MQIYYPRSASESPTAQRAASHLLIHTGPARPKRAEAAQAAWFKRLFAAPEPRLNELPEPLSVKIEDSGGHPLLAIHDPAPLFDIVLPEGDYLVTTRQGEVERQYPMHLDPHTASDLHLRLDPCATV
jgi:hypothetical protein